MGLKISPLVDKAFQEVPIKILTCYPSGPLRLVLGKKSYGTPIWARHILGGRKGSQKWFNGLLDRRCVLAARVGTMRNSRVRKMFAVTGL